MQKHKITTVNELSEDGSRVITEVSGMEIAVFKRNEDYFAVANYCPHQAGPLCEHKSGLVGKSEPREDGWSWGYDSKKKYVTCPWHAWKFDIETGENVNTEDYSVPTFDVEVENDEIFVITP